MIDAPIKRSFPCDGYLRLAHGPRQPVRIIEQGPDYFWVTVWKSTRLPGGRILQPNETACVYRSHIRVVG
jgi:hypothetical protein